MTPEQPPKTDLALRLIACGLPVPHHFVDDGEVIVRLSEDVSPQFYSPGDSGYCPKTRIMWTVVTTDSGPQLLPVLDDPMLLGWLILELERVTGQRCNLYELREDCWRVAMPIGGTYRAIDGDTRIEALIAAMEAAKVAG